MTSSEEAGGWRGLPDLVLVEVFLRLGGGSLHRCRQVCRQWDSVIRDQVWGSRAARRVLEQRLRYNWVQAQPEPRVTTRTLDFSPRLLDANEKYVILREEEGLQGLKVLDQRSNEIWDLNTNCGTTDGFFMWHGQCTEDLIVTTYDEKSHTHLGVWHAPTRQQILKQQLPSEVYHNGPYCQKSTVLLWNSRNNNIDIFHFKTWSKGIERFSRFSSSVQNLEHGCIKDFHFPHALVFASRNSRKTLLVFHIDPDAQKAEVLLEVPVSRYPMTARVMVPYIATLAVDEDNTDIERTSEGNAVKVLELSLDDHAYLKMLLKASNDVGLNNIILSDGKILVLWCYYNKLEVYDILKLTKDGERTTNQPSGADQSSYDIPPYTRSPHHVITLGPSGALNSVTGDKRFSTKTSFVEVKCDFKESDEAKNWMLKFMEWNFWSLD